MQMSCPNCGARLFFDDAEVAGERPTEVRCWMCTEKVSLRDAAAGKSGPPTIVMSASTPQERSRASRLDGSQAPETASLTLPRDQTIKISVVSGPSAGLEVELSRPLVTIGRTGGGADIVIDDAEVSRLHCAIEVRAGAILLHDLSSTNGTFVGEERVLAGRLENMSSFRIGTTVLQLTVISAGKSGD